jgi:hypothetical protein
MKQNIISGQSFTIRLDVVASDTFSAIRVKIGQREYELGSGIEEIDGSFYLKVPSTHTAALVGTHTVFASILFTNIGLRRTSEDDLKLVVSRNSIPVTDAVSTVPDVVWTITVPDGSTNLSTMLMYSNSVVTFGRKSIRLENVSDGAIITHNLEGYVLTQFVNENGELENGVYGQKIPGNLNQVTFRTPILDDLLNTTYTGYLLCEKYT